jgi:hypothetical protein
MRQDDTFKPQSSVDVLAERLINRTLNDFGEGYEHITIAAIFGLVNFVMTYVSQHNNISTIIRVFFTIFCTAAISLYTKIFAKMGVPWMVNYSDACLFALIIVDAFFFVATS